MGWTMRIPIVLAIAALSLTCVACGKKDEAAETHPKAEASGIEFEAPGTAAEVAAAAAAAAEEVDINEPATPQPAPEAAPAAGNTAEAAAAPAATEAPHAAGEPPAAPAKH